MKSAPFAVLVWLICTGPGLAGGPIAALVEDVTGASAGVEFMDYVEVGKVIRLNPQDSIVLNYLYSCERETITGGIIKVGRERSEVQSGKVERASTACDAGRMILSAELASQSAGMLVRTVGAKRHPAKSPSSPQFVLYGLSPIVELRGGGGTVEITRVDQAGERHSVTLVTPESQRNVYYDLAGAGTALSAGGIYRATVGGQSVTFKIDPSAKPGKAPIAGRLLRFDHVRLRQEF